MNKQLVYKDDQSVLLWQAYSLSIQQGYDASDPKLLVAAMIDYGLDRDQSVVIACIMLDLMIGGSEEQDEDFWFKWTENSPIRMSKESQKVGSL